MYDKIYIVCPPTIATGGTELLHQLCNKLCSMGQNAFMFYSKEYAGSPAEKVFGPRYNNPIATEIVESRDNIIVVPENHIRFLVKYRNINKCLWWLSVDNYNGANKKYKSTLATIYRFFLDQYYRLKDNGWMHCVQSEYARLYLVNDRHISEERISHLSDYLNHDFIEVASKAKVEGRKNNILYNPKKGLDFTKQLMVLMPDYNWIPIQNMTPIQIRELMMESKLYIDFGNHPGKDRMPREAAICGCAVVTGKRGAAGNDQDVFIPSKYKFEQTQLDEISKRIAEVMNQFDNVSKDFIPYRERIMKEEALFVEEIKKFFSVV